MSKSANNKGRRYTKGKGAHKKKEDKKRAHTKREKKTSTSGLGSRGDSGQRSYKTYRTKEDIDELTSDVGEFIQHKFDNKEKISVAEFLLDKPHTVAYFSKFVTRDPSARAALPSLAKKGLAKGQTRVISVAEERQFIQEHKHLDVTKKTRGRQKVTAESNPLGFAFAKKFPHLTTKEKTSKISKIRAKILEEQEKERAAVAAAAAIAPSVSNDDEEEEEEIF